jgi:hypothetical protein
VDVFNRNEEKIILKPQTGAIALRGIAWGIAGLNLIMIVGGFAVTIVYFGIGPDMPVVYIGGFTLNTIIYAVLALLIITRHPRHTVGWLFLAVSFFTAGQVGANAIGDGLSGVNGLVTMAQEVFYIPALFIPITLVLQFFPDGRLPSRRWWPVTAFTLILVTVPFLYSSTFPLVRSDASALYETISGSLSVFIILGSLIMVIVRFIRAQGTKRLQMKWLAYTAVILILTLVLLPHDTPVSNSLFITAPTILSLAVGVAILRYRLWDIDLIIRRTLVYSIVTALLAGMYFGGVVISQRVLVAITGQESPLAIVLSTLAIAALFTPLRNRVQRFVDRRFYRQKYDAEQTLEAFSQTMRDEVDLDHMTAELVTVVNSVMQPQEISLWLQPTGKNELPKQDITHV